MSFPPESWFDKPFDPAPQFYSHMCHWGPWAKHFKDQDGDIGMIARMLFSACEEIELLRKRGHGASKAQAELLFAFIDLVETGQTKPFGSDARTLGSAFASIKTLNNWRKENKLNIKKVDV